MLAFVDDWRLAKKMAIAFSFLALLTGALALNGFVSNRTLSAIAVEHVERGVASMSNLADVISDTKELRIIVYSYYNAVKPDDAAKLREREAKATKQLLTDVGEFEAVASPSLLPEVAQLKSIAAALNDVNDRTFKLRDAGDTAGALKLIKGEGKDRSHDAIEQTEKLLGLVRDQSAAANVRGMASSSLALALSILFSLLSLAGLGGVWLVINRTVAAPMGELARATTTLAEGGSTNVPHRGREDELGQIADAVEQFRVAAVARAEADARSAAEQRIVTSSLRQSLSALQQGDLTTSIDVEFPTHYAELKSNYNDALASLRQLIGSVTETTVAIRTGAGEIAQASEDLARRTEANAASLEETAAAVTQMDGRLKTTADAATRTVARADGAIATVSGGREIADEAVRAMTRVSDSAKGIDSVIEGLDKIAFQTRVLAMNAAVEAGRAGEAGRGFAVVADLVSALAMRAEEEAGRARDQLTTTQSDVVAAVEMVQKVDGALSAIAGDVGEVHGLLRTMAEDNQVQAAAITQISGAIGDMDRATQQNAAMVEQTSAAARNLSNEVGGLAEQASTFNTGRGGSAVARKAPPARPSSNRASPVKALKVAALANAAADAGEWAAF